MKKAYIYIYIYIYMCVYLSFSKEKTFLVKKLRYQYSFCFHTECKYDLIVVKECIHASTLVRPLSTSAEERVGPSHLRPPACAALLQVPREHFRTGYTRGAERWPEGHKWSFCFFLSPFSYTVFDLPLIRKVFKLEVYCYVLESIGWCSICPFPHRKKI